MIAPGHGRLEPHRRVAARQHVLLEAEGGNEKAVNHILRGHDELDVLADGNVKFIDLALPLHVLDLPHPLFGDHVDFSSVSGRSTLLKKHDSTPNKKGNHYKEGQDRPADF